MFSRGLWSLKANPKPRDERIRRSNVLGEPAVKLRPSVAEEPEGGAVLFCLGCGDGDDEDACLVSAEFCEHVAAFVADEAVAVEALAALSADAVGGDDGDYVGNGMADHRAAPEAAGVEVRIVRLGADGGGVEQDFRAHQHHRAGGFGIPLVPADADADRAVAGLPYRSEERRVGEEGVSTCRSRWSP